MIEIADWVEFDPYNHTLYSVKSTPVLVLPDEEISGEYRHHLNFDVISRKKELQSAGYCDSVYAKDIFPFRFREYLIAGKSLYHLNAHDKWVKSGLTWRLK
jgi:hypothetical protein